MSTFQSLVSAVLKAVPFMSLTQEHMPENTHHMTVYNRLASIQRAPDSGHKQETRTANPSREAM
jgi:hypothetical protein